jgi:purine-nucleoside phosphorylase
MDDFNALLLPRAASAAMDPVSGNPLVPRLLISVRTPAEALAALSGGADIIDIKEPAGGPLGMANPQVIAEVVRAVAATSSSVRVSAALGETRDWLDGRMIPVLAPELAFVKLGLSGMAERSDWETAWVTVRRRIEQQAGRTLNWIAVAYADHLLAGSPPVNDVIRQAARTGCRGVLVDTWSKERPGLRGCVADDQIREWVQCARSARLLVALAGGLRAGDLAEASLREADVLGIRSAACRALDRHGEICATRVAQLHRALHPHFPRGVEEATEFIRARWPRRPVAGIILGTGMGGVADAIDRECDLAYDDIPHFARSTAAGHPGRLVCGLIDGSPVVALAGRWHIYEGYSLEQITFPIHVLHRLGIERLISSNAAGGLNPRLAVGDLVLIDDHLDLAFARPPLASHGARRSLNFADVYDREMMAVAEDVARCSGFRALRGTYVAVSGPNYETRAEYRMYRGLGGDVIGMSTAPELAVAAELRIPVLAMSMVTNVCNPDAPAETDGASVAAAAAQAEWKLRRIVHAALRACRDRSSQHEAEHGAQQ